MIACGFSGEGAPDEFNNMQASKVNLDERQTVRIR